MFKCNYMQFMRGVWDLSIFVILQMTLGCVFEPTLYRLSKEELIFF